MTAIAHGVEFNTEPYVFVHGHAPRGTGLWAFSTIKYPLSCDLFFARGPYAEAQRDAIQQARGKHGGQIARLFVQP